VKQVFRHGTEVQWQYDISGGREVAVKSSTGERYTLEYSADTKRTSVRMPNGNVYSTTYDDAGRPVEHRLGNTPIVQQRWHANGLLASASCETFALHPEYRDDMVLSGVLVAPPGNATSFKKWAKVKYNGIGQPIEVMDFTGSEIKMGYDKDSRLSIIKTKHGGIQWNRDSANRISEISTSWGYHQNNRYNTESGELEEINLTQSKEKARLQYDKGRLIRVQQYDGGEYSLSYYDQRLSGDRVKEIQAPNGLKLVYEYDLNNRLAAVNCGSVFKIEYKHDPQGRLTELAQVQIKR
jgi:YD repeat-containing protein